jgi:uncharacterized protein YndB with AHSA1/START domain
MPHADNMVVIKAPIGDVFAFLADGSNNLKWRPGVMDITPPAGGAAQGAVFRQGLRGPKGNRFDGDYRITEYDPPAKLAFQVIAGPARPRGLFELSEPVPGATTVKFSLDLEPRGFMKMAMKMMTAAIERTMRQEVAYLGKLKEILEEAREAAPVPAPVPETAAPPEPEAPPAETEGAEAPAAEAEGAEAPAAEAKPAAAEETPAES